MIWSVTTWFLMMNHFELKPKAHALKLLNQLFPIRKDRKRFLVLMPSVWFKNDFKFWIGSTNKSYLDRRKEQILSRVPPCWFCGLTLTEKIGD